jgi:hypothetical protein
MMLTLGVWRRLLLGAGVVAITGGTAARCGIDWPMRGFWGGDDERSAAAAPAVAPVAPATPSPAQASAPAPQPERAPANPPPVSKEEQREFMLASARSAWSYVRRNYHAATGFVGATDAYQYVTMWDVGSILGAFLAARELGFITADDYRARVSRVLRSLEAAALHDGVAFNRLYAASTGRMVGRDHLPTRRGYG